MTYLELERQLRKNNAGHNHSIGYFDNCTQDCLDLNRPSL